MNSKVENNSALCGGSFLYREVSFDLNRIYHSFIETDREDVYGVDETCDSSYNLFHSDDHSIHIGDNDREKDGDAITVLSQEARSPSVSVSTLQSYDAFVPSLSLYSSKLWQNLSLPCDVEGYNHTTVSNPSPQKDCKGVGCDAICICAGAII